MVRLKRLIVDATRKFIQNAWFLLLVVVIQFVATPFILYQFSSSSLSSCFLESIYTFMGDPPSVLYPPPNVYPAFILFILLALRFSGWLIMPILLGIVLDEGKEILESELEAQKKAAQERIAKGEKRLRQDKTAWAKSLKKQGASPEVVAALTSDDDVEKG